MSGSPKPPKRVPLTAVVLILTMVGVLAFMVFERYAVIHERYAPPVTYTAEPDLLDEPFCPGDTIRYEYGLEVRASALPMALTVDRAIWSVMRQDFVVASRDSVTYPYNDPVSIRRVRSYTIPLRMDSGLPFPEGDYRLMVTGEAEARKTVGFAIPFRLKSPALCN